MRRDHPPNPPRLAVWLLERATDPDVRYSVLGDFAEWFSHLAAEHGPATARRWYWVQALKSVPSFLADAIFWKLAMIHNYFRIAVRSLVKRKGYSSINIAGLSVGIAGFLLIFLYVADELSFDSFHENADDIYRVVHNYTDSPGTDPLTEFQAWGDAQIGPGLRDEFPEVLEHVRFSGRHQMLMSTEDRSFQEERYMYVDHNVFNLFSFELISGNPETVLVSPGSIVLTQTAAKRYFDDRNPMGQHLYVDSDQTFVVTGIMKDVPRNSHLDFDMLMSMSTIEETWQDYKFDWGYVDFFTYLRLESESDIKSLEAKIPGFYAEHRSERQRETNTTKEFAFENIRETYLSPTGNFQAGPKGNRANLVIFSAIAFFILLIAGVNYINLSTARSADRAKEIGVRKAVGAQQESLVGQFLAESMVFAGAGGLIAFAIAAAVLPAFANLSAKSLVLADLYQPSVLALTALVVAVVGLIAGAYPALVLSRFRPSAVLKGDYSTSRTGTILRKGLVVFQFAITFALIAGSVTVFSQLDFMQSKRLGFDKDQMMTIEYGFDDAINSRSEFVREAFLRHPAVSSVALSRTVPGEYFPQAGGSIENSSGEMVNFVTNLHEVDYEYIEHFDMELAAGRGYSRYYETDLTAALVINEAAVRDVGYASNGEAIGKRFSQWGSEGIIIGVVKDFNYASLQQTVSPLSLRLSPASSKFITVKLNSDDMIRTVADMKEIFATLAPHRPFLNRFLDETLDAQYRTEARFGGILRIFAGLAIFIACLGLLGLTAGVTAQRRKEISVRKVLGASAPGIVILLSKDFARLVLVASLIATPIVYVGMDVWLSGFAFRTSISPWTFVLAGFLALSIAMVTMNYQTIKAALADPVDSLRSS